MTLRPAPLSRGFTLIELMVTIAIVGIMMALAAPSMGQASRAANERVVINKLLQDFTWARGAAAAGADATALGGVAGAAPQLTLKVSADCSWSTTINGVVDSAHSMTLAEMAARSPGMTCASSLTFPATFAFKPQGFVANTGTLTFTGASAQAFPLSILYSGSIIRTLGTT